MESNRHRDTHAPEPQNVVQLAIRVPRRSSRKTVSIPIWLRNEGRGSIWEEDTETVVVSRFGAGLRCRHSIGPESIVVIIRRDNGQQARARVRYSRYDPDGRRELGIEFIDKDDFWGFDWGSSEPVELRVEQIRTPSGPVQGEPDLDS